MTIQIRNITSSDYRFIISVVNEWWDGRNMRMMLPKLFITHFYQTSFVAEREGEIVGFVIGFLSPAYSDEAYIHFVGVHPNYRDEGIGRLLYEHFFDVVRHEGRSIVRCVTSPVNQRSINFHQRMGFEIVPGDAEINGISFIRNYDGSNEDRVLFVKKLSSI
jgi:ribosomal protein S18 acetylase RimI-like enzyme